MPFRIKTPTPCQSLWVAQCEFMVKVNNTRKNIWTVCSEQAGPTLTSVIAKLNKPTSPSFVSQLPDSSGGPSLSHFWLSTSFLCWGSNSTYSPLDTYKKSVSTESTKLKQVSGSCCPQSTLSLFPRCPTAISASGTSYHPNHCSWSFRLSGTAQYPFPSINSLRSWNNRDRTNKWPFHMLSYNFSFQAHVRIRKTFKEEILILLNLYKFPFLRYVSTYFSLIVLVFIVENNVFLLKNIKPSYFLVELLLTRPRPRALRDHLPLLVPQFKTYLKKNYGTYIAPVTKQTWS